MGWHHQTSPFSYIFFKTHPTTKSNVPSLSLFHLFLSNPCSVKTPNAEPIFADASLWDTRIVGPPDHDPRSDPSNKVAQAPSSRCRDLIKNKWPTWVPQSQKRKYPFFFFLTTAAPFWLLDGGPSKAHLTRVRHLYGRPAVSGLMNGPDPWSDHPVGPTSHTIPHGLGLIPVSGSSWTSHGWIELQRSTKIHMGKTTESSSSSDPNIR